MYAYIKGTIISVKPTGIVLDNNQIGYFVVTPNPYLFKEKDETCVYIYHHVREDVETLYGFIDEETKALFIKLLSVSGIGPKSALSILATNQIHDVIMAIENSDVKFLTKFPGVGTKSAQQIILDLKGKLIEVDTEDRLSKDHDVILALQQLGYPNKEINRVIKNLDLNLKTEVLLKEALKLLMK